MLPELSKIYFKENYINICILKCKMCLERNIYHHPKKLIGLSVREESSFN